MYNSNTPANTNNEWREEMKGTLQTLLSGDTIEVEIMDNQYEQAITNAVTNYRAWSSNSKEEAFLHMKMYESESVYTLPKEVSNVHRIYRRGNGVVSGSGATVDPFSLAYSNTYLLSAVRGSTGGGLLTYDLYHQFDETVGRLFGREIIFNFNPVTKKLTLHRDIRGEEEVLIHCYQNKPEGLLFMDEQIYPWLRDWALSECMLMLGRTRSKFGSIAGPQGSFALDGEAYKQEAREMQERLKEDLKRFRDGGTPYGFIIG